MSTPDISPDLRRWAVAQQTAQGSLPVPVPVPEPMPLGNEVVLDGGDREVQVVASLRDPRVVVLAGVLSDSECDELVALARERLERSLTFGPDGAGATSDRRTSEGMFFERDENELCRRIEARLSRLLDWPVERGEGIQVLRYAHGGEFRPHNDYFDPPVPGATRQLADGGQRVATVIMYLASPVRGGATVFTAAGLQVAPVKGNAVFFSYDRPAAVSGTLHAGSPVLDGEKWAATKWLREAACA
jgi:prolyl 4-hydroxylase